MPVGRIGEGDLDVPDLGLGEAALGRLGEFDHVRVVAGESELVVLKDDLAPCADDLEAVGAGGFAGGRDEHARGAVGPFHDAGDVVLDLDVVEAAELAEAAHARGHSAEPLQDIELMEALVEEHAATLALPRRAPTATGVVGLGAEPVGDDPVDADDLAEFASVDQLLDLLIAGFHPELEHPGEDQPRMLPGHGEEPFGIGLLGGDGLFDHRMEAVLERVDADGRVEEMRRGDDEGVDLSGADHLLAGGEGLHSSGAVEF